MESEIMKQEIRLGLEDTEQVITVCKALSSETRIDILRVLIKKAMSISEIADEFLLPLSSASMHVRMLEEAGLITLLPKPGLRGTKKLCGIRPSAVAIDLFVPKKNGGRWPSVTESMPVGNYSDCEVCAPCGLASEISYLAYEDSPYGFYSQQRHEASLLWLTEGFLEYRFANRLLKDGDVESVELSFEICSEAPGYNNDWPSDITVQINSKKIVTFLTKGDYGDHRGALNPEWWSDSQTQYGELKSVLIKRDGCYFENKKVSSENIDTLGMLDGFFFRFRLGIEEDATHVGGMNIFGKKFGDHAQDINMKVSYKMFE